MLTTCQQLNQKTQGGSTCKLCYANAYEKSGKIYYHGIDKKVWKQLDTYGGKLVENITQAVARDCLAHAMQAIDKAGYNIVMHVHDEIVLEVPQNTDPISAIETLMSKKPPWAQGLPLKGDSFYASYYKKD